MRLSRRSFAQGMAAGLAGLGAPALWAPAALAARPVAGGTPDRTAVQAALDALVDWPVIGAVAAVAGRDGLIELAAGHRSLGSPAPARPHSVGRVASVTKAMTATVAFQEIERGRLSLDTTIDEVLPGLWPGRGDVTLGQLLNHTSGMPDAVWVLMEHTSLWDLELTHVRDVVADHYTAQRLVELARQDDWWFEPGTDWGYSNTGYVVAQMMVERVAGAPLFRLIRERVFRPAGMHRARLEEGTLVRGAELQDAVVRPQEALALHTIDQSVFAGAAAVIATAGDVVRFYQSLMRARLVSQASVDAMLTPVGAAEPYGYGYGMFWVPDPARPGQRLYGHDGAGFGSASLALASRDGERAMAFTFVGRPYWPEGWDEVWSRQMALMRAAFALPAAAGAAGVTLGGAGQADDGVLGGGRIG